MNFLMSIKCDDCSAITNCRFGLSNRYPQEVGFCCGECENPISISLAHPGREVIVSGGLKLEEHIPFTDEYYFIDLHLDFPVLPSTYVPGDTPYMNAVSRCSLNEMSWHNERLTLIDLLRPKNVKFGRILSLYRAGNTKQFQKHLKREYDLEVTSNLPQDINSALYTLLHQVMHPFEKQKSSLEVSKFYTSKVEGLHKSIPDALNKFIDEIFETGFLKNIQDDCLQIYPRLLSKEPSLRSVLFLDFDNTYANGLTPMRVSSGGFEDFKDLYKDICEILSRAMILVAGMNNLIHRQNHDQFQPGIWLRRNGRDQTPTSLNNYAKVDFGKKLELLDDCWFSFDDVSADNQLRNAIAHFKTDYDQVSQLITYFPRREGMQEENGETVYLIDFLHRLLISYREMHRLHHLVKVMFNYGYLIQKRDQ